MTHPTDGRTDLDAVASYRPSDADLLTEWPRARRADVLERVLADGIDHETHPRRGAGTTWRPRRKVAALVVPLAAAAAVAGLLLSSEPDRPPAAPSAGPPATATHRVTARPATMEVLARLAAHMSSELPAPGQFLHLLDRETQDGHTVSLESWTDSAGAVWRRDTAADGSVSYLRLPPGDGTFEVPTPAYLRTLPTDPEQLERVVRANVSGSSSTDEAVFDYVRTIAVFRFAPGDLMAAAIRMLDRTGHVTAARSTDSLGREAIRVAFVDQAHRPNEVQTLYFDPQTSDLLEYGVDDTAGDATCTAPEQKGGGTSPCHIDESHFRGTFTEARIVDSLPDDVRDHARAEPHK